MDYKKKKDEKISYNYDEELTPNEIHDVDLLEFKNFISNLLSHYAKMSSFNVIKYTDVDCLNEFLIAFTHISFTKDQTKNYEYYEFLGDALLKYCIAVFASEKYHDELTSIDSKKASQYITRLQATRTDKKAYSSFCDKFGLSKFIRYKEFTKLKHGGKNDGKQTLDISMKEDVFEAFFGVLNYLINKKEKSNVGPVFIFDILKNFFQENKEIFPDKIPDLKEIEDPTTKIKEIWDRKEMKDSGSRIDFQKDLIKNPDSNLWEFRMTINGFGKPSKDYVLTRSGNLTKDNVLKEFNQEALDILEKDYGIIWNPNKEIIFPEY